MFLTDYASEITISGIVSSGGDVEPFDTLLSGTLSDSASSYEIQDTYEPFVYEVHMYDIDSATQSARIIDDCVFASLSLSGESKGLWSYSTTLRGNNFRNYVNVSAFTNYPTNSNIKAMTPGDAYAFGATTGIGLGAGAVSYTCAKSISLEITNRFIDDSNLYCNNYTKQREITDRCDMTLTFTSNLDPTLEYGIDDAYSQSTETQTFAMSNGSSTMTFQIDTQLTEESTPQPDQGIFEYTATYRLAGDFQATAS